MRSRLCWWLAGLCVVVLGCGPGGGGDVTTPTKDVSRISPPATRSTSSAQGLLLKKQMELVVGGNGGAPATDCHASLMKLVRAGHPIEKPLAWVSSPENDAEVRLLDYAALCLYQFPEGEKAEVTVLVGDRSYTVPVAPESAEYPAEPADSALFDGRAVQTDDGADALRESADWIFFPRILLVRRWPWTAA